MCFSYPNLLWKTVNTLLTEMCLISFFKHYTIMIPYCSHDRTAGRNRFFVSFQVISESQVMKYKVMFYAYAWISLKDSSQLKT
jgi:hypothetical protein